MAVQHQTRCPHCGAQFKISEEHLKQAKGAVRCGSCLEVFQANENLITPEPPAPQPRSGLSAEDEAWADSILEKLESGKQRPARKTAAAPPPPTSAPAAPAETPAAKWQMPDDDAAAPQPAHDDAPEWTPPSGDDDDDTAMPAMEDADDAFVFDEDEFADIEAGLIDDSDEDDQDGDKDESSNDTKVSLGGLELSDSILSLGEDDDDDNLRDEDFTDMSGAGRRGASDSQSDESWAEELLNELDDDDEPEPAPPPARTSKPAPKATADTAPTQPTPPPSELLDDDDFLDDSGDDFFASADIEGLDDGDEDELGAIEIPADTEEEDDVAITRSRPERQPGQPDWLDIAQWGGMALLMLLVFGFQYFTFNFDTLARTPDWRPFYTTVCKNFGCTLPNPSDIRYIRGANLVVRSHPAAPEALVVDVILFNEADYAQPFPVLELTFSNLHGRPIAQRKFQPEDYLHGELAGRTTMTPGVPMHVSFDIIDPGDDAVNYNIRFYPLGEDQSN